MELGMRIGRCSHVGCQTGAALVDARSMESHCDGRVGARRFVLARVGACPLTDVRGFCIVGRQLESWPFLSVPPHWFRGSFSPAMISNRLGHLSSSNAREPMRSPDCVSTDRCDLVPHRRRHYLNRAEDPRQGEIVFARVPIRRQGLHF
jgi:hypothetical protein